MKVKLFRSVCLERLFSPLIVVLFRGLYRCDQTSDSRLIYFNKWVTRSRSLARSLACVRIAAFQAERQNSRRFATRCGRVSIRIVLSRKRIIYIKRWYISTNPSRTRDAFLIAAIPYSCSCDD